MTVPALTRNNPKLTLEGAQLILAAAQARAAEIKVPMDIAVVDDGGHLLAFARHRALELLARHGRVYQAGKNWSQAHWTWIRAQHFADGALARTLEASLEGLEQALRRRAELDRAIEGLADDPRYRAAVDGALRCFRGINTL